MLKIITSQFNLIKQEKEKGSLSSKIEPSKL